MARESSERFYPKTGALPGSLQPEWKRCGKAACGCMNGGPPHGPYFTRRWRSGGRTRKQYVRRAELTETRRAIARWRLAHPSVRSLLREYRALDAIAEEAGLW
jgi:hypothetical protein